MPKIATFALRVLRDFFLRNHGMLLTGAIAYNTLLSLIPLSAVLMVVFSHFFDRELLLDALIAEVSLIAPGIAVTLSEVLVSFLDDRHLVGWVGGLVVVFFSSVAFRVLEDAFSIIFHQPVPAVKRKFWVSALLPYLFILLIAGGLIVVTTVNAIVDALPAESYRLIGTDIGLEHALRLLIYITGVLGIVLLFTLLYKIMPVVKISFRRAFVGGVTAGILWEITRQALVSYYTHISVVNVLYGSMATVIIVLLTMEVVALIVLLGAQVIADLQRNANEGIPWHEDPEKHPG
ncbi:MAG: YihY/virulence factor BrkB family protein [Verrucomicrobiales bacterium]